MRLGCKRCILIYLGAILLMSHIIANNVSAFDFTSSLWFRNSWRSNALYWQDDQDGTTWRNSGFKNYGTNYGDSGAVYFRLSNEFRNINIPNNSIVVITGSTYVRSSTGGTSNTVGSIFAGSENLNCNIVEMEFASTNVENITTNNIITFTQTFTLACVTTQDVTGQIAINLHLETMTQNASDYMGITFKNMYYFRQDTSIHELFEWLQNNSDDAGETLKQEKQDVQDAADNSETAADNNSENAATTNLVGALSSLLSALTNLNATNCNVTLPFPSALGGNMTVNICQNKDYAGNIISVFGSLTLCVFYVPLALKLLSMIYNEIRSFTNG